MIKARITFNFKIEEPIEMEYGNTKAPELFVLDIYDILLGKNADITQITFIKDGRKPPIQITIGLSKADIEFDDPKDSILLPKIFQAFITIINYNI